jgi:hypothetical protein
MAAGSRLTITGPEKWSVLKMHVPPDWKKWADKDLFVVRGPGSISMCSWGPDEHDVETPLVIAEFATAENLSAVELVEPPRAPLGWDGQWFSARQPDGSFVHRLAVRMVDLDQKTGRILASVDRLEFKLTLMN